MGWSLSSARSIVRAAPASAILASACLWLAIAPGADAGGQGTTLPPPPLPVRAVELSVQLQARMVCVADPNIVCDAPYLDAGSDSITTDGGTFRSLSCPGSNPPGACRPDFIPGAELTGQLVDTWDVVITPIDGSTFDSCNSSIQTCTLSAPPTGCFLPPPGSPIELDCDPASIGGNDDRLICQGGKLELNVTAPGVSVSNPIVSLDPLDLPGTDFECGDSTDPFFPATFGGEQIEPWWVTRQFGATCDIALEYALSFLPRDQIRAIGQQAFPDELCKPDGMGVCTYNPEPVFVEPDGSLTKGCGSPPSNTFTIRFAKPNEPVPFAQKSVPATPLAVRDVDADGDLDLVTSAKDTLLLNDGSNDFTAAPSGLPSGVLEAADVGDWTQDGNVDLVARWGGGRTVFPGDGAGSFTETGSISIGASAASRVELRDLNADSRPEAVFGSAGTDVVWNLSGGSTFLTSISLPPQALTDIDGDGDDDLVAGNQRNPLSIDWSQNITPMSFFSGVSPLVSVPDGLDALGDPTQPQELLPLLGQAVYDGVHCEAPAGVSDCCSANGGLGCDDSVCETTVCSQDPVCCDTGWDSACASEAQAACTGLCPVYGLECEVSIDDVAAGDVDGDGDADLFFCFDLKQTLLGSGQDFTTDSRWIAWIPNLESDDPVAAGGSPLFDVNTESWRLLGRAPGVRDEFDTNLPAPSEIRLADVDGDSDLDVVAVGLWYRNDGGSFSGPFALQGELTRPARPDVLFVDDVDGNGDTDVVTSDRMWVPEPGETVMLLAGLAGLFAMQRRRSRTAARRKASRGDRRDP